MSPAIPPSRTETIAEPTHRQHAPGTRVRAVNYDNELERHAIALLEVRAFSRNKIQRWFGGVSDPGIPRPPTTTAPSAVAQLHHDTRNLYYFFDGFVSAICLTGSRATVVVEPAPAPTDHAEPDFLVVRRPNDTLETQHSAVRGEWERIRAISLWSAPGSEFASISTMIRAKQYLTLTGGAWLPWNWTGWGFGGLYRTVVLTKSRFEAHHKAACAARSIAHHKCWTLQNLGTDPSASGKGYGLLLLRDGMSHLDALEPPAPCLLEVSEPRPKIMYSKAGWQETSQLCVGQGIVDDDGFAPDPRMSKPRIASGFSSWTMIRLPSGTGVPSSDDCSTL
ncbi:hypothetical protein BKA62DRAFT_268832 [Auriculariales sp. MPI-PUGE-AT-0066]|nr:hypothetical protein BKA62DRAFT_268832 [Auriculariales sp. MPI-PUGE-AT-0066]